MIRVALKMLIGDRAKYIGLVFGIMFATLLMSQQVSIFVGILERTASQINDVKEADIWVMDSQVRYIDEALGLPKRDLLRVRSIPGVQTAVPFFKSLTVVRPYDSTLQQVVLLGLDDDSLIGKPAQMLLGEFEDIKKPDSLIMDKAGFHYMWPNEPLTLGKIVEAGGHRMVVRGICEASPPFMTFPIVYTRFSQAVKIAGDPSRPMSFILAKVHPGQDPKTVAKAISKTTGLQALTSWGFQTRSIMHYLTRTGIPINFGITVFLGFLVGTAIAGQTFYMFVVENLRQFAALKAIGVTNRQILKMVLLQASCVGLLGFSIGMGLCSLFFTATSGLPAFKGFMVHWQVVAGTFLAVSVIILLSSLFSIRRVLTVDPGIVFK